MEKGKKRRKKSKSKHKRKTRLNWKNVYSSFVNGKYIQWIEIVIALIPLVFLIIEILSNSITNNVSAIKIFRDGPVIRASHTNDENLAIKSLKVHSLGSQPRKYANPIEYMKFQKPLEKQISQTVSEQIEFGRLNEILSCPIVLEIEYTSKNKSKIIHQSYLYKVIFLIGRYDEENISKRNGTHYAFKYIIAYFQFIKSLPSLRNEQKVLELYSKECKKEYLQGATTIAEIERRISQRGFNVTIPK